LQLTSQAVSLNIADVHDDARRGIIILLDLANTMMEDAHLTFELNPVVAIELTNVALCLFDSLVGGMDGFLSERLEREIKQYRAGGTSAVARALLMTVHVDSWIIMPVTALLMAVEHLGGSFSERGAQALGAAASLALCGVTMMGLREEY
jgi:hypothetical protein